MVLAILLLLLSVSCASVIRKDNDITLKAFGKAKAEVCEITENKCICYKVESQGFSGFDFFGTLAIIYAKARGWF